MFFGRQKKGAACLQGPESILIVRLSAIGDIVMASGVLPGLRQKFPQARIDWLVQEECAPLLAQTPELDKVLVWPRRRWEKAFKQVVGLEKQASQGVGGQVVQGGRISTLSEVWRGGRDLLGNLHSREYDLVLDLQGLWKSAAWAWLSRAKHRVGLDCTEGSGLVLQQQVVSPPGDKRIASEYKTLLSELFCIPEQDYALGIKVSETERSIVRGLLQDLGLVPKRFVLFCPFTTRPQKHWPQEKWLSLGLDLTRELGLPVLVLGGPGDREEISRWRKAVSFSLFGLAGQTSLLQSLVVVQEAALVVGVDTGLTHMAVLSKVPTIALFGATCPYLDPGHDRAKVLYQQRKCSPCKRNPGCRGKFYCMQALGVELVKGHCLQLVGG